ncbi:hypothetical protein NE293_10430 [Latilactobacillus curvatus]|uniref:hypothetical protein n=1 Tax=Latilactobacillus curvatus TaxID=28038 RepID=UPI0020739DA0|nr:hypothetical protein [Latilactobacillus curvatus]MCM6845059.1 hypothetical protein [Latilactobacillus curvatus]MCM6862207.1 hypothetical protein [Latilactobacillus curvatus]MCM6869482.1 hypothetical protein [Latilactobacillus curvatus]
MDDIKVLILAVQRWSFKDDNGENRNGMTAYVSHIAGQESEHVRGHKPVKYTLPAEKYHLFDGCQFPCFAKMETDFDFDRQRLIPVGFGEFETIG